MNALLSWSDRRLYIAIGVTALVVRLAAVALVHNFASVTGYENEAIARNLLAGHGYSMQFFGPVAPTADKYPLYTFFLAAAGVHYPLVEIVQALLGAIACVMLVDIGRRLLDRDIAVLAALLAAIYPIGVYWTTQAQSVVLDTLLLEALCLLVLRAETTSRWPPWAWAGCVLGLAGLSKTVYLAFFPALGVWVYLRNRPAARVFVRQMAVMVVAAGLTIAPWTARNYLAFHRLGLVTLNGGYNLWIGNNPYATGSNYTADGRHMNDTITPAVREELARLPTEADKDALFGRMAMEYIRANPGRVLALIPAKITALWWFDPEVPTGHRVSRALAYCALVIPALTGMWVTRRRWRDLSVFYGMYAIMTGIYAVYFGQARFRYVLEWSLILFAAAALRRYSPLHGYAERPVEGVIRH